MDGRWNGMANISTIIIHICTIIVNSKLFLNQKLYIYFRTDFVVNLEAHWVIFFNYFIISERSWNHIFAVDYYVKWQAIEMYNRIKVTNLYLRNLYNSRCIERQTGNWVEGIHWRNLVDVVNIMEARNLTQQVRVRAQKNHIFF